MEALAVPTWNPVSRIWSLSVKCPLCKQRVRHGGGDNPEEVLYGSRSCNNCMKPIKLVAALNK